MVQKGGIWTLKHGKSGAGARKGGGQPAPVSPLSKGPFIDYDLGGVCKLEGVIILWGIPVEGSLF